MNGTAHFETLVGAAELTAIPYAVGGAGLCAEHGDSVQTTFFGGRLRGLSAGGSAYTV